MQARDLGAEVRTYTACVDATRCEASPSHWALTLVDKNGSRTQVTTRALVNAAGPWAIQFLDDVVTAPNKRKMRLVKGSHIVVPKIHAGTEAYILQNADGRIVFALPYEDDYTLIGTTDVNYTGDPRKASIDSDEMTYLIAITNRYFKTTIAETDVIHTFCGVRPLLEEEGANAQALSRDYEFKLSGCADTGLLLNIFGGKITTYRKLAEHAVNQLAMYFPHASAAWTAKTALTGGDFAAPASLQSELEHAYPYIDSAVLARYVRSYGSLTRTLLANITCFADLGADYGAGLYEAELRYLRDHEFATCAEDVLWRRSKLGLKCRQSPCSGFLACA
jgi:glycerol-3-phosphate dehydrogenase